MPRKLQPINYTSREFDSIRRDLENYAKRYYPNTYKDFNEASFGSLMLDTVSYIGDILSFYLDYQANESFLDSAIEYNNVVRLARQVGFKISPSPSSYGVLTFYIEVPTTLAVGGAPDLSYAPTLRAGSQFSSLGGGTYTLLEDVNFSNISNLAVAGAINSDTNSPNSWIIRAQGEVVSGRLTTTEVEIGEFERFLKVQLPTDKVAEIISVEDSEGHEYFEVSTLSQNVVYKEIQNNNADKDNAPAVLKAVPVGRRFTIEYEGDRTFLQFGYGSDSELLSKSIADPSEVVLQLHGRDYVTDREFDPTRLIDSDKFGIAPANTTLRIVYRINTVRDANAAVNSVTDVGDTIFKFTNSGALSATRRSSVQNSLELTNEEPITGDISLPSSDEVRQRVLSYFATQNRAVTPEDYVTIAYAMPGSFGAIKRCALVRDFAELRRNLNLYVVSEAVTTGKLIASNATLKSNLKTWLSQYKMVNDTIDILDARIVNFGVQYIIMTDRETNRYTALGNADTALRDHFSNTAYIGEPIYITDIYKVLQGVPGVVDVLSAEIVEKSGGNYSETSYNMDEALSSDGRFIEAERNIIFEIKYPDMDIKGSVQ